MRQMVRGHVLEKGAREFVVADAAIEPAREQHELNRERQCERPPIGVEEIAHGKEVLVASV